MNLGKIRHKLRRSLAERGPVGTLALAWKKSLRRRQRSSDRPKEYAAVHPFDRQFGVDTSGRFTPEELSSSGRPADVYNAGYFGIAPTVLRKALEHLQPQFEQCTFIDLGSGKGRALLVASDYPFRAIRGVEISPILQAIATENISSYCNPNQRCRDIRSVHADATEFVFPSGPLVVYLWNPFDGPVFRSVLANLERSLERDPRDVLFLYVQPNLEELLASSRHWREVWHQDVEMSEEDYAACAFPNRAEPCTAFRSVLHAQQR